MFSFHFNTRFQFPEFVSGQPEMWSLVLEDRCASIAGTWSGQDLKGHLGSTTKQRRWEEQTGFGRWVVAWENEPKLIFCRRQLKNKQEGTYFIYFA